MRGEPAVDGGGVPAVQLAKRVGVSASVPDELRVGFHGLTVSIRRGVPNVSLEYAI